MYKQTFNGKEVTIDTDVSLFSPNGADKGTLSMLRFVSFKDDDKVLDLGCGTGIVSLAAACHGVKDIVMTDIDPKAVSVA